MYTLLVVHFGSIATELSNVVLVHHDVGAISMVTHQVPNGKQVLGHYNREKL